MSQIAILGRQPALGLAELESLYGADVLTPAGEGAVRIELARDEINPDRLGGTLKLAKFLTTIESTDWQTVCNYLNKTIPHHLQYIPEGKVKLGISTYGLGVKPQAINAQSLQLKSIIKRAGRSTRVIANKSPELNTAQVQHGGLVSATGVELLLIADGASTILAQTHWVQDIDAYSERDQKRPKRDSRVGMLPPKLAQIIINLALGSSRYNYMSTLHDPFCGTGVLLQEALLMDLDVYGSDIEIRMVNYSQENMEWLNKKFGVANGGDTDTYYQVAQGDATSMKFPSKHTPPVLERIASETYLGRPLSSPPDHDTLRKIMSDCDTIHRKFLQNVRRQSDPGFRMCIAVPAWHTRTGFKHLKTLDSLEDLGYNRIKFVHAEDKDLVYHRPGQIVARELVVLERI